MNAVSLLHEVAAITEILSSSGFVNFRDAHLVRNFSDSDPVLRSTTGHSGTLSSFTESSAGDGRGTMRMAEVCSRHRLMDVPARISNGMIPRALFGGSKTYA